MKTAAAQRRPPVVTKPPLVAERPPAPTATPWALPPNVQRALQRVMSRKLSVSYQECTVVLLAVVPLLLVFQALADWLFNLPWGARAVLLLADLGAIAYIIYRYAWVPFRKRLNHQTAALLVEREIPDFRSSLISLVQLSNPGPGWPRGSDALVMMLAERLGKRMANEKVAGRVVSTKNLKRWMKMAVGALALAGTLFFVGSPKSQILAQRILLANVPLPTETVVEAITRDAAVPTGSDVTLSAKAVGVIPKSGRVQLIYAKGERQNVQVFPSAEDPAVFSLTLKNLQQAFQYRFTLNDGEGEEFAVNVQVAPAMESCRFLQTYPDYTGIKPAEMSAGNLTLLAGSKFQIEGKATQSLQSASVQFEGGAQPVTLQIHGSDRRNLRGDFVVPKEKLTGFSIHLVNNDGIPSTDNTVYKVDLIADKAPQVELAKPTSEKMTVTNRAKPVLEFTVKDDFGIKSVALVFEITKPVLGTEEPGAPEPGRIELTIPSGLTSTKLGYTWDLSIQKPLLTKGYSLRYWIEAVDNNNVTGPGIGESAKKTIAIVSEEDKKAELMELLGAKASDLENVYNSQKKVNEDLDATIRKTQP
jgi:hypothetical protein